MRRLITITSITWMLFMLWGFSCPVDAALERLQTSSLSRVVCINGLTDDCKAVPEFDEWFFTTLQNLYEKKFEESTAETFKVIRKTELKVYARENRQDVAGVFATRDVAPGEELFRVPYNMMITSNRILEVTELKDLFNEQTRQVLNDEEILAFYIAYLKLCDPEVNPWAAWINTLPTKLTNILFFTDDEVSLLNGTSLYERVLKRREKAKTSFDHIKYNLIRKQPKEFVETCDLTMEEWKWALAIVLSRSIQLLDENFKRFPAIIPYFDFFNHKSFGSGMPTWGYNSQYRFFHVETPIAVHTGNQIFLNYGPLSNAQLLETYGFILEDNPDDKVFVEPFFFGVSPEDYLQEHKQTYLDVYLSRPEKLFLQKGSLSQDLWDAVHVVVGDDLDFTTDGDLTKEIGIETEIEMCRFIQTVCWHKLQKFPTAMKDDTELMRSSKFTALSPRAQMAIKMRNSERNILIKTFDSFASRQNRLLAILQKEMVVREGISVEAD